MPSLISPAQTAFVRRRSIIDNMILMKEVLHTFNLNNYQEKYFVLKADINKVFDTIEWYFIEHALKKINVPENFIKLILSCLSSSKITV
jgi:Reverse transcriptase (RNA-dependent DNA polymerase)